MKKLILLASIVMLSLQSFAKIVNIPKNADGAWYFPTGNHGLLPGDTVNVTGNIGYALFEKVNGTAANNIVFLVSSSAHIGINDKGVLGGYGLLIQNSSYFKVIGNEKLKIGGINSGKYLSQGIGLHNSTFYEVTGCEVQFTQVGLYSNGVGYHMQGISIHDNVIHDTDNPTEGGRSEGIYFGNTSINSTKNFSFRNIKIYRNRFYKLSGDGIQLALAINYEVYENTIDDFGRARNDQQQNEGIIIGSGSSGVVRDNIISNGSGCALQCFGATNYFLNNKATNVAQMANEDGVYIGNRTPDSATVVYVVGNVIDKVARDYIRKEDNTTVYQNSNQFGGVVVIPPLIPVIRVDSVSKGYCDSTVAAINKVCKDEYNAMAQQISQQKAEIEALKAKQTTCEALKTALINFQKP